MRQKKAGQNPLDPAGHSHASTPHALQVANIVTPLWLSKA